MFDWLKKLLGKPRQRTGNLPESRANVDEDCSVVCRGHVLLTRRYAEVPEELPGFGEAYFCTKCKDYFVLRWHPSDSPFVSQSDRVSVLSLPPGVADLANLPVFCPGCRQPYPMWGKVAWAGAAPRPMKILERFSVTYPPSASGQGGDQRVTCLGQPFEHLVVFAAGEGPPDLDKRAFIVGFLHWASQNDRAFTLEGSVTVHVLWVDAISDESAVVFLALKESVLSAARIGLIPAGMTLTGPVRRIEPFSVDVMMCFVPRQP